MIELEELKKFLLYQDKTGKYIWLVTNKHNSKKQPGEFAGWLGTHGYIMIGLNGEKYRAHILAWFYMTGKWPEKDIDHINGIKHDNRWCNLREATESQNGANSKLPKNNTSGYKGVSWDKSKNKWTAYIKINKKKHFLGYFDIKEEAARAYDKRALEIWGMFAKLNFPLKGNGND